MLAALSPDRYRTRDIYIDTRGQWHAEGKPIAPERVLRQLDVALLPLHGEYGKSGKVQRLLEQFSVPYVGADSFASYLSMHKVMARAQAEEAGLATPGFRYIDDPHAAETVAREVIRTFHQPVVVKAVIGHSGESSVVGGYAPVLAAITTLFGGGARGVMVEEYLRGREAVVGLVEGLRDENLYALPPVEIVTPTSGPRAQTCPGHFSRVEAEELARAAKIVHRTLGLRHCSESRFILTPRGLYYLETNTLPTLAPDEAFVLAIEAVGLSLADFLAHLIERVRG